VVDTIPAVLAHAAARHGDRVWLRTDDGELSFARAAGLVRRIGKQLRDSGVASGDRVLLTARNTPAYLLSILAVTSIEAIAVPTNPASTPTELAGLIGQTRPRVVITDADLSILVDAAAVDAPGFDRLDVEAIAGDWSMPVGDVGLADVPLGADPADVAVLIPTSGTTGRSKLVMQTHRAYTWAGQGFPWWMELGPDDRLMTSLPLFHINAPAYSVMGSLSCGAGLVLLPKFSARDFIAAARRHRATEFNAIGAMLEILMRQPARPDDAETDLRLVYTGPSPSKQWQEAFEARFGLRIVCGYAMSESPYGLIWPRGSRPFGTLGTVRQHPTHGEVNRARVVDDDRRDLGPGETGELLLDNPVVTPGYWEMPEMTAATIVDGWLHTGDLVTVNADDTYTFVGRKKEVVRRRGENLSPAEVEDVIAAHADVIECSVVGVVSELTEEEVKAFVVLRPDADADFDALRAWAAEQLSAFKVPRYWQAVDALPRTPTSRVAKHQLPAGHPDEEYDAQPTPTRSADA
jgi:crotonobetaine/carnitine-CoA ligase